MLAVSEPDTFLTVHAENDALLQAGIWRLRAAGRHDPLAHCESRPPLVEVEAVRRAIFLAGEANAHVHIAHVSAAGSLVAIAEAKRDDMAVTAETCPQYLLMTEDDVARWGPFARCAPAIRTRDHVEAMWQGLSDGTLDFVCSDHAPYTTAEKEAGRASIWEAPLGLNVIQVMYPAVLDEALHTWGFPWSSAPRLPPRTLPTSLASTRARHDSGWLRRRPGALDFEREWTIRAADLLTKHQWTPFDGRRVRGQVVRTISHGRTIYADGRVLAEPGSGRFLRREADSIA